MNKKILKFMVVLFMLSFSMVGAVGAKSLYVIANINASPTPINAYDVQGDSLVFQATHNVPCHASGAVGLSIDTDSEFLFVTYEGGSLVELVNATTMVSAGNVTAPGSSNLAGIVVDQDQQLVYTVDRNTNHLYVYEWDISDTSLTLVPGPSYDYHELPNCTSAHGIALDEVNDLLYVGDNLSTTVRFYDTSTWTVADSFDITQAPMGIAVDVDRGFVYTGNAYTYYGSQNLLCKYDLNTNTESTYYVGYYNHVLGLAVDPATGLLYITTGDQGSGGTDQLMVFDSDLNILYETSDIGDPTGLCVPGRDIGYNPLNFSKVTSDTLVAPGSIIEYTITYDNELNDYAVDNVIITDNLPSDTLVDFHSTDGNYDSVTNTVTWDIGTLVAGATPQSVWLKVQVNSSIDDTLIITNYCTIESDQTPPTTKYAETEVRPGIVEPTDEPYFCPNPFVPDPDNESYFGLFFPQFEDEITSIKVYDVSNQLVAEYDASVKGQFGWNGRNDVGEIVANGVYFCLIESKAGEKVIIKVAVLR